jgi:hypothetical protein
VRELSEDEAERIEATARGEPRAAKGSRISDVIGIVTHCTDRPCRAS